jgi:hypothetical protein
MANPIAILSFVWTYVVPVLKDGFVIIKSGVYEHIKDRVDDEDIRNVKGITKRNKVFASAEGFLDEKGIDPNMFSSVLLYLLIEIAVANLKKRQKKLLK